MIRLLKVAKAFAATVLVLAGVSLNGAIAVGVTATDMIRDAEAVSSVTPGAAIRAHADVQIRRIKTLIITRNSDRDADFQQLEKLQKDLRGER